MRIDWLLLAAIAMICGGLAGLLLLLIFPEAVADSSGPLREVYLSDSTRCVVSRTNSASGITCDWERRYACDSQRLKP